MSVDHVAGGFVRKWFDLLNEHAPVENLLDMVSDTDLTMVFPEATLRNHGDFRRWYDDVGRNYTDQSHVLQELDARDEVDRTDVQLTVVWKARQLCDGAQLAFRVNQSWQLRETPETGKPVISTYKVLSIDKV